MGVEGGRETSLGVCSSSCRCVIQVHYPTIDSLHGPFYPGTRPESLHVMSFFSPTRNLHASITKCGRAYVKHTRIESECDSEWFLPLLSAPQIALLIEKHWCERREEKKKERSEQNTERIDDPVEVTHKMCCWWLETRGEEDNSRLVSDSQKHLKICSFSAAHNIYHLHPSLSLSPPLKCWELL